MVVAAVGAAVTALDPRALGPAEWTAINRALAYLALFTALTLAGALALVAGQAILPSYVSGDVAVERGAAATSATLLRRVLRGTVAVAALLAGWALLRGIGLALAVAGAVLPPHLI